MLWLYYIYFFFIIIQNRNIWCFILLLFTYFLTLNVYALFLIFNMFFFSFFNLKSIYFHCPDRCLSLSPLIILLFIHYSIFFFPFSFFSFLINVMLYIYLNLISQRTNAFWRLAKGAVKLPNCSFLVGSITCKEWYLDKTGYNPFLYKCHIDFCSYKKTGFYCNFCKLYRRFLIL